MAYSVTAVLRVDEKKNKDGLHPIYIRVSVKRASVFFKTGEKIAKILWDETKIVKSAPNASLINAKVDAKANEIKAVLLKRELAGEEITPAFVKSLKEKKAGYKDTFYTYAEAILARLRETKQDSTAMRYARNLPVIRAHGGSALMLSQITPEWLHGFERYCYKRGDAQNIVRSRMKFIAQVVRAEYMRGRVADYPFGQYKYQMPAEVESEREYLTFEELDRLMDLHRKQKLPEAADVALSFFLVECTSGIRHSDWSRFQTENMKDTHALKVRAKKNGVPVYVPISSSPRLAEIIAHIRAKGYVYTKEQVNEANRHLIGIAIAADITKPLTTHIGRHTAATLLLEQGFSKESVAEVLGISMRLVEKYAKVTGRKVRNEFEKHGGL